MNASATDRMRHGRAAAMAAAALCCLSPAASAQVTDAQIVVAKATITANGYAEISARCPAGYVAVSGGVDAAGPWRVTTLAPTFGNQALFELADGPQARAPDGWYASIDMTGAPATAAIAVACARLASPAVTVVSSGRAAYFADTGARAQCPAGYGALGGGIDVERAASLTDEGYRISGSYPLGDGSGLAAPPAVGWRGGVHGDTRVFIVAPPPGPVFRVGAICAQGIGTVVASGFGAAPTADFVLQDQASCPGGSSALAGGARLPEQWLVGLHPVAGDSSGLRPLYLRNPGTYPIGPAWRTEALPDETSATSARDAFTAYAVCAVVAAAADGTVVEFYNGTLDHYFITASPDEAAAIDLGAAGPGWTRTGATFGAGGDAAACRFYGSLSPGPNSHFYTINPTECHALRFLQVTTPASEKRWNFENYGFTSNRPIGGGCPAGTAPVYRAYNNGFARGIDSNHRITSDPAGIQQVVARGWVSEGIVMCAPVDGGGDGGGGAG